MPQTSGIVASRMTILRTSFVTLLLVCAANASRPLESARDQYKAHEDVPHPPQLLSEATDQAADVHRPLHIDPFVSTPSPKKAKVRGKFQAPSAELQTDEKLAKATQSSSKQQTEEGGKLRQGRSIEGSHINTLRNYYNPWAPTHVATIVQVPPLDSYSLWQPQVYQISRPYFIPLWGSPGKIPIFFPPQPLYPNPGYPADNPPKEYLPPNRGYLPPDNRTPAPPPRENVTFAPTGPRFEDNPPVWDAVPVGSTTRRPVKPTRRPRPQGPATTHPPLVHNTEANDVVGNHLSVQTTTPPSSGFVQQRPPSGQRPQTNQRPTTGLVPPAQEQSPGGKQPSRCVWAIISCCSGISEEISYSCFEQLGCVGAFWDSSPCQSDFARAAIADVMNYYNTQ